MTHILKRLQKDIEKLNDLNLNFELNENELVYKRYKFIIGSNYPFTPPKLILGDTEYINFFIRKYIKYNKNIPFLNIKCPCCFNITCEWCPSYNLRNMFNECKEYLKTYHNLFNFLIVYKAEFFDDLVYKNISEYFIDQN
jgi:hypothetical protein